MSFARIRIQRFDEKRVTERARDNVPRAAYLLGDFVQAGLMKSRGFPDNYVPRRSPRIECAPVQFVGIAVNRLRPFPRRRSDPGRANRESPEDKSVDRRPIHDDAIFCLWTVGLASFLAAYALYGGQRPLGRRAYSRS